MLHLELEKRLHAALLVARPGTNVAAVRVMPAPDAKFGDYQCNALMTLARELKTNPRQLATEVVAQLNVADLCEPVEIAGPGFLNFRLKPAALGVVLAAAARGEHLFFAPAGAAARTYVVDFSSPNVAKPMHVGHIRSTILGDSLARTLRLLGHRVITDNHIGDWGTQFGMLLVGYREFYQERNAAKKPIEELVRIYRLTNFACDLPRTASNALLQTLEELKNPESELSYAWNECRKLNLEAFEQFCASGYSESDFQRGGLSALKAAILVIRKYGYLSKESPELIRRQSIDSVKQAIRLAQNPPLGAETVREAARLELVKLQSGDADNIRIWQKMIHLSRRQFDRIYERLGVKFDHTLGESFYNPWLKDIVARLVACGLARESEGAIAVFSDGTLPPEKDPLRVRNRSGEWVDDPLLIQKSDGASNYATTDLATLDYRLREWRANEIIYVVGSPQQPHFNKLFNVFRRWQPEAAAKVKLTHAWFGSILGDDGKPFKTRSGETVKLADLLDEAEERALKVVAEKRPDLDAAMQREIARKVGLGSVKYQDLLSNRQSDYVFNWDKMLALSGNTAVYVQYQFTRAAKVARDGVSASGRHQMTIYLTEPAELALAKHLLNFGRALEAVSEEFRPNLLCNYLYELASAYSRFYDNCPVLKAEEPTRSSRLVLCELTAKVLKDGLGLLGIETIDEM